MRPAFRGDREASIAKRAEEGAQIFGKQLRLLHRGKVAASRHVAEALDVVERCPHSRGGCSVSLGKSAKPAGTCDAPTHSLAFSSIQRITEACVKS